MQEAFAPPSLLLHKLDMVAKACFLQQLGGRDRRIRSSQELILGYVVSLRLA